MRQQIAKEHGKQVATHLYGQEITIWATLLVCTNRTRAEEADILVFPEEQGA